MSDSPQPPDSARSYNLARVLFLSFTAAIGGFLFGFDSGVINGAVGALEKAFNASSMDTGFNVASMLLGCAVGAFFAGTLSDKFGRKPIMLVTAVGFLISAWGSGIASGSFDFVLYRILGGLSVGAASILAPAYISEVAPPQIRGGLASLQQLMIVLGLFVAFLSDYLIAAAAGGASAEWIGGFEAWRWMFWMEIIPSVIFFAAVLMIPESPRYLVADGKREVAKKVVKSIHGETHAEKEISEIEASLENAEKPKLSNLIVKATGKIHPLLWIGIGLAALQQLVGINVIFYYGSVLWQAAGFDETKALFTNVVGGAVNIVSTLVAIALVDKVGRKPLLLIGSIGMAITLGGVALIFSTGHLDTEGHLQLSQSMGVAALIVANLYIVFFAISWGPVMWVMLGEMFPNRFRGSALAVCGFVQWIANFTITMTFPPMLSRFGLASSYAVYAFFAAFSIWFVAKMVKETKGKTLEQME